MMKTTCIDVQNLQVAYHTQIVLDTLSTTIPCGEITGIIGPNGSGKTTFLKAILGLIPSLQGTVTFLGKPLKEIRDEIAYVPQRESVDWDFPASVYDIVSMGRLNPKKWWHKLSSNDKTLIDDALKQVKLTEFRHRQIGQLSGGQQQRVFLARALAQQASVILMDEPFVGVDMASQEAILTVLRDLRNAGKTIVIVHHDLSTVAAWFDHVVLLNNRLVQAGPINEVLQPEVLAKAYGTSLFFKQTEE